MESSYSIKILSLFVLLLFHFSCVKCKIYITKGMEVHITNGLPNNTNPLELFCQSKETHFGYHKLNVGEEFYWKFHLHFAGATLYWCRFYWGNLVRSADVFNDDRDFPNCDKEPSPTGNKCYWLVKEDGFYNCKKSKKDCFDWEKIYEWKA
ncbi:hypothetical protein LguiA_030373 [Lonicera macranthoides]